MNLSSFSAVAFMALILGLINVVGSASTCDKPVACPADQVSSSAQIVVNAIDSTTKIAQRAESEASQLSAVSQTGIVSDIVQGLVDITSSVSADNILLESSQTFNAACDAAAIAISVTQFAQVTQAFIKILIQKSNILTNAFFVGGPVENALRDLEAVVDTFSTTLVNHVPTEACYVKNELDSLLQTLHDARDVYS